MVDSITVDRIEWRALVYFCRLALLSGEDELTDDFEWHQVDWEKLRNLAGIHSVRPLFHQGVSKWSRRDEVPAHILNQLEVKRKHQSYVNMDHTREMIRVTQKVRAKGVELIPYKGVVLAEEAYGDVGLREMSDIDFLMKLRDFSVIRDELQSHGYVPSKNVPPHFEEKFFKQNFEYNFDLYENNKRKYHVEPHWKIGFKRWQTDLDFNDILPFTSKRKFFGTYINMLTPEGLLLTTSLHHGGEDRWNQLKYICDVAAIVIRSNEHIDWTFLINQCEQLKVRNIVFLGVSVARRLFQLTVSQEVEQIINRPAIRRHTSRVISQLKNGERSANINTYLEDIRFHFSLRQHLSTKLKVVCYHLVQIFIPTVYDVNDKAGQGKNYWWLFLTKPLRIWRMHVRNNPR